MKERKRECKSCEWWMRGGSQAGSEGWGECRLNPPVPAPVYFAPGLFPYLKESHWCGQWKEA